MLVIIINFKFIKNNKATIQKNKEIIYSNVSNRI